MTQNRKNRYLFYPLQTKKIIKEARKQNKSLRKVADAALAGSMIRYILEKANDSDGFNVHCDEYFWSNNGKHHIILPDIGCIDGLLRGKYDIDNVNYQIMPHESFMLILPAGFSVNGLTPSGVMITSLASEDIMPRLLAPFTEYCEMENTDYHLSHPKDTYTISLNYTIQGTPWVSRQCINSGMVNHLLACKTAGEYQAAIGQLPGAQQNTAAVLDASEQELAFVLMKLAFSLAVYTRCKPGVLKQGFPKYDVKAIQGDAGQLTQHNASVFDMEMRYRSSPTAHPRGWFIRTLRHEKYYRGAYANWPRGSRTTFVDETTVSGNADVKHL